MSTIKQLNIIHLLTGVEGNTIHPLTGFDGNMLICQTRELNYILMSLCQRQQFGKRILQNPFCTRKPVDKCFDAFTNNGDFKHQISHISSSGTRFCLPVRILFFSLFNRSVKHKKDWTFEIKNHIGDNL